MSQPLSDVDTSNEKNDQDQQPNKKRKDFFKSMRLHSIEQNCIIHKTKYGQSF